MINIFKDWNSTPPHEYLGSYKLNYDRSWSEMSDSKQISPTTNYFMQEFSGADLKQSSEDSIINESEMDTESADFQICIPEDKYRPKSSSHSRKACRIMKNVLRSSEYV